MSAGLAMITSRYLFNRTFITRSHSISTNLRRHNSNDAYDITLNKNETCFIAYHPEKEHPYELTKPLPKEQPGEESVLKVDSKHMITQSPNLDQLQTITRTPRRYWHQYPGRDKRNKYKECFNDNVDRPGLTS